MSATSARNAAPSTAEHAPKADAAPSMADDPPIATPGEVSEVNATEAAVAPAEQTENKAVEAADNRALDAEDAAQQHKALTIARIRLSRAPAELKERFANVAEGASDAATVEACLKAVEESLPEFLQENRGEAARSEHPAGEVFFRGNAEEITDEQAEEIAQRQLARSGLLRGQRVKVAD